MAAICRFATYASTYVDKQGYWWHWKQIIMGMIVPIGNICMRIVVTCNSIYAQLESLATVNFTHLKRPGVLQRLTPRKYRTNKIVCRRTVDLCSKL